MIRGLFLLFAFTSLLLASIHGQDTHAHEGEPCGTMEMDARLRKRFPNLGTLNDFESELQQVIRRQKELQKTGKLAATVLTIPVIVHIVHNGENIGVGTNISAAAVSAQMNTLNKAFRNQNIPVSDQWASRRADIEIEFCTAIMNPSGVTLTERGIERINGGKSTWTQAEIENYKSATIWDPTRYYNVWVFNIASSGSSQLLGYAQFPSSSSLGDLPVNGGSANTDGVVIHSAAFGADRQTLSHETGHWLGLRHIWGDANCGDDYCADTPQQQSASSGCPTGRQSCGTGNINMVENYMDYTNDGCMNIFTNDQKSRMRAVMAVSPRRFSLTNSNVCGAVATGPLVADFVADRVQTLLSTNIQFSDRSSGQPTSWSWTFAGGVPATSASQNPLVTYNVAGKYAVTLTVSNATGSNTLTKTQYIEVLAGGTCATPTNMTGTPILIRDQNSGKGYISGTNGRLITGVSDYFENKLGYTVMSGVSVNFAKAYAKAGASTESVVNITVWNARGYQGGPGSVIESKEVPLRSILEDVAAGRRTEVVFDREAPLFGAPYHIGVEIVNSGDSLAVYTSKDGTDATSWERDKAGDWDLFIRRNGAVVSLDVKGKVGIKPSVNLYSDKLFINPGEAVTLQASGAAIYQWTPVSELNTTLGPQVVARPKTSTTYFVKGSGLDLCVDSASVKLYVRNVVITGNEPGISAELEKAVTVSPNPVQSDMTVAINSPLSGKVRIGLVDYQGRVMSVRRFTKSTASSSKTFSIANLSPGVYLVEVSVGDAKVVKRIVKE